MRDDLEFLYQRAMRTNEWSFMAEVFFLLIQDGQEDMADRLTNRMLGFMRSSFPTSDEDFSKYNFLIGDSQMGADWYRTR